MTSKFYMKINNEFVFISSLKSGEYCSIISCVRCDLMYRDNTESVVLQCSVSSNRNTGYEYHNRGTKLMGSILEEIHM